MEEKIVNTDLEKVGELLRDLREICNDMIVSTGSHSSQMLYCKVDRDNSRKTIKLGVLAELSKSQTD